MSAELKAATLVLLAVAKELAHRAQNAMPKLRKGERIRREWYADGVYYRETVLDGETCLNRYDFRAAAEQAAIESELVKKSDKKKATA